MNYQDMTKEEAIGFILNRGNLLSDYQGVKKYELRAGSKYFAMTENYGGFKFGMLSFQDEIVELYILEEGEWPSRGQIVLKFEDDAVKAKMKTHKDNLKVREFIEEFKKGKRSFGHINPEAFKSEYWRDQYLSTQY